MAASRERPSVAILGCGAVGEALARALGAGWEARGLQGRLALWSRSGRRAAGLARLLGRAWRSTRVARLSRPEEALERGTIVLLCVSDAAIAPLAERLGRTGPATGPSAVLHTNGLLGLEPLSALRARGFPVGRLHPFVAITRARPVVPPQSSFGIEGDARALRAARALVGWLKGRELRLRRGDPGSYHAAASLMGGGVVALYELSERVLARSIPGRKQRARALIGLARSVLANLEGLDAEQALTGALARGSEPIVRAHLQALGNEPAALEAYRVLGETILALAKARGSLDARTYGRLGRALRAPRRRR